MESKLNIKYNLQVLGLVFENDRMMEIWESKSEQLENLYDLTIYISLQH